ncbi:MAG TPA: SIS domain-containing protein [Ferruginibacter sp.]|nr:SIS domain-containing protein [Ferruginibacter sp.]HMP20009.1 SIS domain-containing protein [Ferruginibacter sp.]
MNIIEQYISKGKAIADKITAQQDLIEQAAQLFAQSISKGRMVHVFGSGHSRMMVEEMWPRYGSFPGFNPIVELSLSFHNLVVGANGQRQAMFLENVPGLAARILRNFDLKDTDTALVISSSGCNVVPIEMAEIFQQHKIKVVAVVTSEHLKASTSKRADGKKLSDFADIIIDTAAPAGDSMIYIDGLETPVAPGSTIGGVFIINAIKARTAELLTQAGFPPKVLTAACVVGSEKATALFEAAYDEHAHRLAKLYDKIGYESYVSGK